MTDSKDGLTRRYDTFMGKEMPWAFFLGLADYVEYILSIPQFSRVVELELGKRDSEYKILELYEETAVSEMDKSKEKLLKIIQKKKINPDHFSREDAYFPHMRKSESPNAVEYMKMYDDGVIGLSGFHSDNIEHFLFDISANLLKMGYKKDIEEFIASDDEYVEYYEQLQGRDYTLYVTSNQRGNFIFSKIWPSRFEQVRKIETQRKMEPWGAFEELIKIWHVKQGFSKNASMEEIFVDCQNHKKYQLKKDEAYKVTNLVNDIKIISENHRVPWSQLQYFRIDDLKSMVERVHTILVEKNYENVSDEQLKSKAQTKALQRVRDKLEKGILIDRVEALEKQLGNTEVISQRTEKNKSDIDEIYYNNKTAIGDINGKEFRFKPDSPTAEVFSSAWGMINVPLKRQEVLVISSFYTEEQEPDHSRRTNETYHINKIAKAIRSALKISPKKLINNDGNLTLIGRKLKNSKLNQVSPN